MVSMLNIFNYLLDNSPLDAHIIRSKPNRFRSFSGTKHKAKQQGQSFVLNNRPYIQEAVTDFSYGVCLSRIFQSERRNRR